VVFSGSVPAGVPRDIYASWIADARARGARTALDADGDLLARGLEGRPDLVKPNRSELEAWAGSPLKNDDDLFEAVRRLRAGGADTVAVSLGADGAWLFWGDQAWFAPGLRVSAQSTVGAGDALVASLTWGLAGNGDPGAVLARAVATATASVVRPGTGAGSPQDIKEFLARVAVQKQSFSWRKS
jgi:1-phosphofructokinase